MISSRLKTAVLTIGLSIWALVGVAHASTTGYEQTGNPWTGLEITILLLLAVIAFTLGYIILNKFEQWWVDLLKENNDIEGLIKSLRSPWFSTKAARALGEIGDERAIDPLISALDYRSAETREAVADALGNIGDERAVEKLNAALGDRYVNVREHAKTSIEKIRSRPPADGNRNTAA
jgi:hypothetical protein